MHRTRQIQPVFCCLQGINMLFYEKRINLEYAKMFNWLTESGLSYACKPEAGDALTEEYPQT